MISVELFAVSIIMCNILLIIGWFIIYKQRKQEGRGYYSDGIGAYAVTYVLLIVRNLLIVRTKTVIFTSPELFITYAIYIIQLYGTYRFIWSAWVHTK